MIKKFSTAMILGATALVVNVATYAQQLTEKDILPDAPAKYVVKRGDTLWSISKKYVKNPIFWPELWKLNRQQVRNPHLIYPGDVLILDLSRFAIKKAKPVMEGPQEVALPLEDAIPSIPANLIRPFLSRPLIVDPKEHNKAPYVVAANEGTLIAGAGDKIYVRGLTEDTNKDFYLYRPGRAIPDPDAKTNEKGEPMVGYEAEYVGVVRLGKYESALNISTFVVQSFEKDVRPGDRLLPVVKESVPEYIPHAPETTVKAKVVGVYGETGITGGPNSIVVINAGTDDKIAFGHVLALETAGSKAVDPVTDKKVKLPDERNGELFIFKTFNKYAYGLVMRVDRPVHVGDKVTNP